MIEVGEYVRTIYGKIFKITAYDEESNKYHSVVDMVWNIIFPRDIKAHSKNIIDLIEIDDFITLGKDCYPLRVDCIWHNGKELNIELEGERRFEDIENDKEFIIYSIVTKEQFAQMEYKVEV